MDLMSLFGAAGNFALNKGVDAWLTSRERRSQEDTQREFAQHGISWRVEDAKRAGVHPLYAIGANVPTYSPSSSVFSGGGSDVFQGQDVSRAANAGLTAEQRAEHQIRLLEAQSRISENDMRRQLLEEQLNQLRNRQPATPLPSPSLDPISGQGARPVTGEPLSFQGSIVNVPDWTKVKPAESTSTRSGSPFLESGVSGGFRRFNVAPGLDFDFPAKELSEPLESMSESMAMSYSIYKPNRDRGGKAWADAMIRRFGWPVRVLELQYMADNIAQFGSEAAGPRATQRATFPRIPRLEQRGGWGSQRR